jgi:DNA-binding XRE family transcriptional regulator
VQPKFGKYVKKLMDERHITFKHFAALAGISQANMLFIQLGTKEPSMEECRSIAKVLDMTVRDLILTSIK